jgi:hypothetical protein
MYIAEISILPATTQAKIKQKKSFRPPTPAKNNWHRVNNAI